MNSNVTLSCTYLIWKSAENSAEILEQQWGARNRVGIGLSYRPAIDFWAPSKYKNTGSGIHKALLCKICAHLAGIFWVQKIKILPNILSIKHLKRFSDCKAFSCH
jgi:hypothetical protein